MSQITVQLKSFAQPIDQLSVTTELVSSLMDNANLIHSVLLENVVVRMDLVNLNRLVAELLWLVQSNCHINVMIILVDNTQMIALRSRLDLISLRFCARMVLSHLWETPVRLSSISVILINQLDVRIVNVMNLERSVLLLKDALKGSKDVKTDHAYQT